MKKVLFVIGTRPDAIKTAPIIIELKKNDNICTTVCISGQHYEMLNLALSSFGIVPDFDLRIMKRDQTLFDITINILDKIRNVLDAVSPDIVMVHGDTTTAFSTALACFYKRIPVAHIEAGLRSFDLFSPYPEEFNRRVIDIISTYHYAPTKNNAENLRREGISNSNISITGNTIIDIIQSENRLIPKRSEINDYRDYRLILFTMHRREHTIDDYCSVFRALRQIVDDNEDVVVIYPLNMNSRIRDIAYKELKRRKRIKITEPLEVSSFHDILEKCYLVITDSGGVQEEASFLGKPIIVIRDNTERQEVLQNNNAVLVGTDKNRIVYECSRLLVDEAHYNKMSSRNRMFGDGHAASYICQRIIDALGAEGNGSLC